MSISKTLALCSVAFLTFTLACSPERKTQQSATSDRPVESQSYAVVIDRAANGASSDRVVTARAKNREFVRKFAFEVEGFGTGPKGPDSRSAGLQAAILDALTRALIEARRARGQPIDDFTAKLSSRLTLHRRVREDKIEVELILSARAQDIDIILRDGVLTTPPLDMRYIRRIFDETNGEFALLSTGVAPQGRYRATVACYQPASPPPQLAGEPKTTPPEAQ